MKSIFDYINENINTVNENVLDMMNKVANMEQEVIALRLMFSAPDKPTALGGEGAVTESREQEKTDEV